MCTEMKCKSEDDGGRAEIIRAPRQSTIAAAEEAGEGLKLA